MFDRGPRENRKTAERGPILICVSLMSEKWKNDAKGDAFNAA